MCAFLSLVWQSNSDQSNLQLIMMSFQLKLDRISVGIHQCTLKSKPNSIDVEMCISQKTSRNLTNWRIHSFDVQTVFFCVSLSM